MENASTLTKPQIYLASRIATILIVAGAVGPLFWQPVGALQWTFDLALRTWLMFLGTVMAHEAVHGQMGRSKRANSWWGRVALIPVAVPYANFRKTHRMHHAHTNDPANDPDHFVKPNALWEVPFRSLAVPHHWLVWLYKRGKLQRADLIDIGWTYVGYTAIYAVVLYFAGASRLAWGTLPPLFGVSIMLWYWFAVKTHEGFSMGPQEERSHNYYGKLMYWFTLGLSMHRAHHLYQHLSWIELLPYVEDHPGGLWQRLLVWRDHGRSAEGA